MLKKFIFTPLWRFEKTEKLLSEMEANGLRLAKISFGHIFHFEPCEPKKTSYFLTSILAKGLPGFYDTEQYLRSECNGDPVKTEYTFKRIHRMTEEPERLTEIKEDRSRLFYLEYKEALIVTLFFALCFAVITILTKSLFGTIIAGAFTLASVASAVTFFILMRVVLRQTCPKDLK